MTDDAFIEAVEDGSLDADAFGHREHLRLAWLLVRRDGREAGSARACAAIRAFAAIHGAPDRYQQPLTRFWLIAVAHDAARPGSPDTFEAFLEIHPRLLRGDLRRHWTPRVRPRALPA